MALPQRRRWALGLLAVVACGGRTGLLVPTPPVEAGAEDAPEPAVDASGGGEDAPGAETSAESGDDSAPSPDASSCSPGTLGTVTGDVFGQTLYFANGVALAPGRYRVSYLDGCMKYAPSEGWTVNAYALGDTAGSDHWWFVSQGQNVTTDIPPGTVGFASSVTFDECVKASQASTPVVLTHPGGPLGVWLEDAPYSDNVPGLNGRSPTWTLECVP